MGIYKEPEKLGLSLDFHEMNKADFETNYKNQSMNINEVIFAETIFISELSYANFKAKITSPIVWSDVKYTDDSIKYILNLVSENPL